MDDALRRALEHEIALGGPIVYVSRDQTDRESASSAPAAAPLEQAPVEATVSDPPETRGSSWDALHAMIPAKSPLHEMGSLDEVRAYVETTELIELDRTRTNPVFGVGNPDADLMVIGEAPGADEDARGEPFVGRAGQLLDRILGAIGFQRDDVYIANILKSRPPNNRNPQPDEIAAHEPILYKQIALIRPRIILSVGLISATTLLRKRASLTSLRQTVHDFHGIPLLATYHPAALLRNPNWKRPTWEDVQLLRAHYDRLIGENAR